MKGFQENFDIYFGKIELGLAKLDFQGLIHRRKSAQNYS